MARKVPNQKKLRSVPAAKSKKPVAAAKPAKAAPKPAAKNDAKAKPAAALKPAAKVAEAPKGKAAAKGKAAPPAKAVAAKAGKEPKVKEAPVKKKRKGPAVIRLKAFWGVFNQMAKRVAVFEFAEQKLAAKKAADLSVSSKQPHFVQLVKEVIRDEE